MERPRNIAEKFVTSADGTRVFAGAVGDPSRPALVFVHGYSLTSEVFNEIFAKPENSRDFYLVSSCFFVCLDDDKAFLRFVSICEDTGGRGNRTWLKNTLRKSMRKITLLS